MIGLARYTESLCRALSEEGIAYSLARPAYPLPVRAAHRLLSPFGLDTRTFFTTYPLAARLDRDALVHLTAQQMATLLWLKPRLHRSVVTVHDIVPFLVRRDQEQSTFRHPIDRFLDRLAMSGLKRADALISDSYFTRDTLLRALDCRQDAIHVVPLGVAHDLFRPQPVPRAFFQRHRLDPEGTYVLYVGSENPRKNLPRLVRAFATLRQALPDARLIKLGSPEYTPQAQALRHLVEQEGLAGSVLFYDHVSDQDLALFYNMAALFVFPSLYEGFGLPPLEAMACGTPVVCSDAASLPEVVGDAALTVDPTDVDALAGAMHRVLTDPNLAAELRARGLARAATFTWERTARETVAVYSQVLDAAAAQT